MSIDVLKGFARYLKAMNRDIKNATWKDFQDYLSA